MEELIKELKEDKKRAWEMISFLHERLSMAEKLGKDEELHSKMDKILEKLEKQAELEKKVDRVVESQDELKEKMIVLNGKINNSVAEVTNSKEMLKVIDTVETVEGYVELFVKDFEKIHGKMDHIEGKAYQFEHKLNCVLEKMTKMEDEIKENKEEFPKMLMETQKETLLELKEQCEDIAIALQSQKLDIEEVKREMARKPKIVYKCCNSNCHTVLTKDLVLREDGVSVQCPNIECCTYNIVDKLKEGYKWMYMSCNSNKHYQQYPLTIKDAEAAICLICVKLGKLYDASISAIISVENTETDVKNSIGASHFVRKATKVKEEKINKCWNSNCNAVLPKTIALRKDGVSVTCSNSTCRYINIVGSLKEGNRWVLMECNGNIHYQQFSLDTKLGDNKKCQICGEQGRVWYRNAYKAKNDLLLTCY